MGSHNYVANPSYEASLAGVTAAACTIAQDSVNTQPGTGKFCMVMTADGSGAMSAAQTVSGLTVGTQYTASTFVKLDDGVPAFSMMVAIDGQIGVRTDKVGKRWFRILTPFVASATSVTLSVESDSTPATGKKAYVDLTMVSEGPLGPYFDGSYPYCSWSGTAQLSSSSSSVFVDSLSSMSPEQEDVLLANGFCLNSMAWAPMTRNGRLTLPAGRGDNIVVPGQRGQTFVPNKPKDIGQYTVNMFILGAAPDGTIPTHAEARRYFEANYTKILQAIMASGSAVVLHSWQPDGSVRQTNAQLDAATAIDPSTMMGGRRAEVAFLFDILDAVWADYLAITIAGSAGTHWTSDTLTLSGLAGGSAPIEDAVITVAGPITNPKVQDPNTGTWVQYTGTVASGQTWVVDCGAWTSEVNGSSVLAATTHFGHPRFVVIDPGNAFNAPKLELSGSGTGTNTNLTVTAKRQHWYG